MFVLHDAGVLIGAHSRSSHRATKPVLGCFSPPRYEDVAPEYVFSFYEETDAGPEKGRPVVPCAAFIGNMGFPLAVYRVALAARISLTRMPDVDARCRDGAARPLIAPIRGGDVFVATAP